MAQVLGHILNLSRVFSSDFRVFLAGCPLPVNSIFWLHNRLAKDKVGLSLQICYMATSSSASGVWFPRWAEVLAGARLKDLERRVYRLAILQYLVFCKRSRQRATVASARMFMEQIEQRQGLGVSQLATWKAALNWFFRTAPSGGALSSGAPGGKNLKAE